MALTEPIWQDILTRIRQLRADVAFQWAANDVENTHAERTAHLLGQTLQAWESAEPLPPPQPAQ